MTDFAITAEDVRAASKVIKGKAHVTPVVTNRTLTALSKPGLEDLFFKCENFQKVGAFKFRGAANAVFSLTEDEARAGVTTHSSGNHGQALAAAAALRGIPCTVVIPSNAPPVKKRSVEEYGATVIMCEPNQTAREAAAQRVVDETGATFVHPYNNVRVMAGQGTLALELLDQVKDLDAIIVPVGGGGMISGVCIAAHSVNPNLVIIGAEPALADDAYRSLAAGEYQTNPSPPQTIADGLKTNLGSNTWPIIKAHVDRIITVSDDEIRSAMRLTFERAKLVIEPSAAVGVAVAFTEEFKSLDKAFKKVGIILCGGNVDLDTWKW